MISKDVLKRISYQNLKDDVALLMRFWGYDMVKQKVGLLFGGCSGEHEVSIASAKAIAILYFKFNY